jgi:FkbM family methyltransferase
MKKTLKSFVQSLRTRIKYRLIKKTRLKELYESEEEVKRLKLELEFLKILPTATVGQVLEYISIAPSQLRQDLFVLSELGFKHKGFFVEFGAADGYNLSNSWLLETHFGWKGILSEPGKCWHEKLAENRKCHIDHRCVWSKSDLTLEFKEAAEISTVSGYGEDDAHHSARGEVSHYSVQTISLEQLMEECGAPTDPDYLSIDTEGSEFEILSHFNFSRYPFKVITCEHNFTPMREKIHQLLTSRGYVRKYEKFSLFDDWYVRA